MKIADKILVLVLVLIAALSINTAISIRQVSRLGQQLRDITEKNNVLTDVANTVSKRYLENAVRFQALLNAGDELAFAEMPESRRQYLLSHINSIRLGFDRLTQEAGEAVLKGKDLINRKSAQALSEEQQAELTHAQNLLGKIETAYIEYDTLFNEIYRMISAGGFELSLEDLNKINQKEKVLSQKITRLVDDIHLSTQKILSDAAREGQKAREVLVLVLQGIVCISILIAFFIIRSFSRPLKELVAAAKEIGVGNFKVHLNEIRGDEIGEVSQAFNTMTHELDQFKTQIEQKNAALAKSLAVTESQKQDLQKVNTELDRFVYTVSNDVAAPLTGIEAYGDYLEKHQLDKMDEKSQRSLVGLRRATKRMNAMMKDLLALTRISRIKNPYENVDIQLLLDVVLERLEYVVSQMGVKVSVSTTLPNIVCDRVKISEVFNNLIMNAIKFAAPYQKQKGAHAIVEIGCQDREQVYEFFVRDNGPGIAAEHHADIFELFKRLESTPDHEGTGAGLSIVKAGIEDHGGTIWLESKPGEGATFYFTVPKGLKATLSKLIAS